VGRGFESRRARQFLKQRRVMATRSFKGLVRKHVADDPAFAEALLRDGVETLLSGDVDTGKAILCDYIKATSAICKSAPAVTWR
jgi:hypothetical protein